MTNSLKSVTSRSSYFAVAYVIHGVFTVTNNLKSVTIRSSYFAVADVIHGGFTMTNSMKSVTSRSFYCRRFRYGSQIFYCD